MSEEPKDEWGKYLGLGLEMAVGAAVGFVVGRWLDHKFGWTPRGTLTGLMLGIGGGMYLLIREAIKANKD